MEVIKLSEVAAKKWSGGTTSELFIYPKGSSFSEGSFELRISIATVELDETTFTPLSNTLRTLLVLEGNQLLRHQGAHTSDLTAFQQDTFSGDWTTFCSGKSTNFNVMTMSGKSAKVAVRNFQAGEIWDLKIPDRIRFIFLWKGKALLESKELNEQEGIAVQNQSQITFKIPSKIVIVDYP